MSTFLGGRRIARLCARAGPTTCLLALLTAADGVPAAVGAPAVQAQPSAGKLSKDWTRLQSLNFVVVGNASRDQMKGAATELEAFRAALLQMFPTLRLSSPVPTRLVVFKDDRSFSPFKPRDARGRRQDCVGGYFYAGPDVNSLLVASQGERAPTLDLVFHEYMHYVLERNLRTIPAWLGEGLAEFHSTFRPHSESGRSLVGVPRTDHLQLLTSELLIPLERLLSVEGTVRIFDDGRRIDMFYAQSWALVHYLYLGHEGKRRPQLDVYLKAIQRGLSIEQAFQEAFHCSYDELESELRSYLRTFQMLALVVPRPEVLGAEKADAISMLEADAHALQADLLWRVGAEEDAEKAASRALALQAGHPQAQFALASVRLAQERYDEAITLLQSVVDDDAVGFAARLWLSSALVEVGRPDDALVHAQQAAAANEESPDGWFVVSMAQLAVGREDESDATLRRVFELDARPGRRFGRAYGAFRLGRDAAAVRAAQDFLDHAGWGAEQAPYVVFLATLAQRRLGRGDDADAWLDRVRPSVQAGSWTATMLDYLQRRLTAEQFLSRAKEIGEKTEAHCYIGFDAALGGRREEAITHFTWVKERGSKQYIEYGMAVAELRRLLAAVPLDDQRTTDFD